MTCFTGILTHKADECPTCLRDALAVSERVKLAAQEDFVRVRSQRDEGRSTINRLEAELEKAKAKVASLEEVLQEVQNIAGRMGDKRDHSPDYMRSDLDAIHRLTEAAQIDGAPSTLENLRRLRETERVRAEEEMAETCARLDSLKAVAELMDKALDIALTPFPTDTSGSGSAARAAYAAWLAKEEEGNG